MTYEESLKCPFPCFQRADGEWLPLNNQDRRDLQRRVHALSIEHIEYTERLNATKVTLEWFQRRVVETEEEILRLTSKLTHEQPLP